MSFMNLGGTCATDPLYILLAREDEAEAETYENGISEGNHQQNLTAERETGSIDFGSEAFSLEEESVIISSVEDKVIDMLIEKLTNGSKMDKEYAKSVGWPSQSQLVPVKVKKSKMDKEVNDLLRRMTKGR